MAINVKPLGDRVLVQPLEEKEVKKGGIIIPDTAKEKPQEGTVVAAAPGIRSFPALNTLIVSPLVTPTHRPSMAWPAQ
jgi:co-chaperonin GroES (HSP10)